jgi:hypothetical protein
VRARSIRRIAALACIAASTGATSAQAALPPHVRAPTHVTVGERVTLNLSTFRPGTTVAVQLTPTAHLGGNC